VSHPRLIERSLRAMSLHEKLSVIIPSYKRSLDLKRCLAALALQSRPADEVVVIAREEDTETSMLVSSADFNLKNLRLLYVSQPGLIAAMNHGLDNVEANLLVFTDDDTEAQADWLERIDKTFDDPRIGAVGGRDWLQLPLEPSLYRPAEVARVGVLSWYGKPYGNHHCPVRGHRREVMFLKGVNMAIRQKALGSGRIDSRLRGKGSQVGTELDLCMQIRRSGFLILFDDRILVKHYSSPRPKEDDRGDVIGCVTQDICFNTHYLIAKHFGLLRSLPYWGNNLLFGGRSRPGVLAAVKWRIKGDRSAFQRLLGTVRMASSGFLAGRKVRTLALEREAQAQSEPEAPKYA
jgi:glycosyltransferase involved in cell wall biosynthesis